MMDRNMKLGIKPKTEKATKNIWNLKMDQNVTLADRIEVPLFQ
jgi:hypothetical protein